ncbi:MAG: SCO family protein [Bacteroidetes bacterium]|nr:SCO family protein [Bacteroidota bacterium]
MKHFIILSCLLGLLATPVLSNNPAGSDTTAIPIGITEQLGKFLPDSVYLTDENGKVVNLKSLVNKPTVLAFVYFDCPGICSPLLDGVSTVVSKSDLLVGKDYQVITISIDSSDTPEKALQKKHNFADRITKGNVSDGWHFLTGTEAEIQEITRATGFGFRREGRDFVHSAAIIVVSPQAKITRYLFGTYFLPFDLKMAVIEANEGKTSPTIAKVLKYCFNYDPEGRRYVLNVTRVTGTLIFLGVATLFIALIFLPKRNKKKANKD